MGDGVYLLYKFEKITVGRPRPLKFPVQRDILVQLLEQPGIRQAPYVTQRNALATILTTVCCSRWSEVAALQACDLLFDFDVLSGPVGQLDTVIVPA